MRLALPWDTVYDLVSWLDPIWECSSFSCIQDVSVFYSSSWDLFLVGVEIHMLIYGHLYICKYGARRPRHLRDHSIRKYLLVFMPSTVNSVLSEVIQVFMSFKWQSWWFWSCIWRQLQSVKISKSLGFKGAAKQTIDINQSIIELCPSFWAAQFDLLPHMAWVFEAAISHIAVKLEESDQFN